MDVIRNDVTISCNKSLETQLLCDVSGQTDCQDLNQIQCQQNYFLFENQMGKFCVICPYQNYKDSLTLYCMDCVENPYTWDVTRQCTYDYQILNGDSDHGVYTRVNRSSTELYYVDLSKLAPFLPITYLCNGCQEFCRKILDDSDCKFIISPHEAYDPGHSICQLKCQSGYYANYDLEICSNCVANCQSCDKFQCLIVQPGFFQNYSPNQQLNGQPIISQCSDYIPFCDLCIQDTTLKVLCQSCQKTSSGIQYIQSLNLQQCELCDAYCSRCEYTTYNKSVTDSMPNQIKNPTQYGYTDSYIQANSLQYIKRCRQCSNMNYIFSLDAISCTQCLIQNCRQCYYNYSTQDDKGRQSYQTTLDLDYIPTTQIMTQLCYSCQIGFVLSSSEDQCHNTSDIDLEPYCSSYYNRTNVEGTNTTYCFKCNDTFFYNINTQKCQIHEPNQQTLIQNNKNEDSSTSDTQINNLAIITCSTYLKNCLECYMYRQIDIPSEESPTTSYVYQCVRCVDGYYPDFFSGLCLMCKAADQLQTCATCSQYSNSYNYTNYLILYPVLNSSQKSILQTFVPPNVSPMCFYCFKGFNFFNYIKDCDTCGSDCFTDSCQDLLVESYCQKCWPPLQNYTIRSLTNDHNQCHDCPLYCEACRDRNQKEKLNINIDFNPVSTTLEKYSLFCYQPANISFYDSILGMPVQCANSTNNKCKQTSLIEVLLFCSADDYSIALRQPNASASYLYNLRSYYTSSLGTPTLSFDQIDNIIQYTRYNEKVIQELFFTITFIEPSIDSQTCMMQQATNLEIYFSQNVFSLKNLVVTLQGSASHNQSYKDQTSNTIIALSYTLNILFARNVIINGLSFIYPLDCTLTPKNQVYVWGLKLQNNHLSQFMLVNSTFGADATYLIKMNTTNLFNTNEKFLFQFIMNNVYNLTIINVNINYNNYTNMLGTNPLTRTFDENVTSLDYRITFIDGLNITGLGLYGVPLFVANDVPTNSQLINIGTRGLNFKFCDFYDGSHIFSESPNSLMQSGQINISRLVIQQSNFVRSSIFQLSKNLNNGTLISNVDIIGCNFSDQSYGFYMNNFQLVNIFTYMLNMNSQSSIINTQSNIPDDDIILQNSLNQKLTNIHFSSIICQTAGFLIAMTSPYNILNLQSNVTIQGMVVENTIVYGIDTQLLYQISHSLIQFLDVGTIVIANFRSDNNLGTSIIRIELVLIVKLYDCLFDWTDAVSNNKNLIPLTLPCYMNGVNTHQSSNIQIYIDQFLYGVYMQNVTIQNLLPYDNPLIYIASYNILKFNTSLFHPIFLSYKIQDIVYTTTEQQFLQDNTTELITFIGCSFINNRLVIQLTVSYTSVIFIRSQQYQLIAFIDCLFKLNHLHQIAPFENVPSTSCINIESLSSNIVILTSNFTENAATQTQYGSIYILSTYTIFSQSRFEQTNIYDKSWNSRLQPNNLNSSQFEYYFEVTAYGGNAYINSFTTIIQLCTFNYSSGIMGAGIYLKTLGQGNISIESSTFVNLVTNLEYLQASQGGAIFIDSSNSELQLNIQDTKMKQCKARVSGGCIQVLPSAQKQQIIIKRSQFENCYSLRSAFMEVNFPTTSFLIPDVKLLEITVSQDLNSQAIFYQQVPDIIQSEIDGMLTNHYVYRQNYGGFKMFNSNIQNIYYYGVLGLTQMIYTSLTGVTITDSTLYWVPLINIDMGDSQAQIMINDMQIENTIHYTASIFDKNFSSKATIVSSLENTQCILIISEVLQNSSISNSLTPLTNITCKNNSQVLFGSRYSDPFQSYYQSLNDSLKYGLFNKIEDLQLSDQDQQTYQEDIFNLIKTFGQDSTLQDINASQNMDYLLSNFLEQIKNQQAPTALISINNGQVLNVTKLTVQQINQYLQLQNNFCESCFGGLMQILGIKTTLGQSTIQFKDSIFQNNTSGYYGCLTFTQDNQLQRLDDIFGYKDLTSQRLLMKDDMLTNSPIDDQILQNDKLKIDIDRQNLDIYSQNLIFSSNVAFVGSGLSIFGLNSFLFNTQFYENQAILLGAGIFFDNTDNYNLFVYNSTFSGNRAQVGAAIMLVDDSIADTTLYNLKFSDNEGTIYAANLAEYPQSLTIQIVKGDLLPVATFLNYSGDRNNFGNVKNKTVKIKDFVKIQSYNVSGYPGTARNLILPSGQKISTYKFYHEETKEWVPFNYIFRVINLNRYNQQIQNVASNKSCTVTGRRQTTTKNSFYNDTNSFFMNYTNLNRFYYSIEKGAYDLDDLVIKFDPKLPQTEYLQLRIACTSVKIPVYSNACTNASPYNIIDYNTNYVLYVNISTFPCQFGEYYSQLGGDNGVCLICADGSFTYSVDPSSQGCKAINRQTMLNVTSSMIQVLPEFWRPYDDNVNIEFCFNLQQNCLGGWQSGQDSCYEGHIGALCESCDLKGSRSGESWAQSAPFLCGKCSGLLAQNTSIIFGISVFTLLSIIASVSGNYEAVETFIRNQVRQSIGVLVKASESSLAILIKILTNYFQIITAVSSFQLSFPPAFGSTVNNLGSPIKSMAVSYDCFFQTMSNINILYFRVIWSLMIPFLYLCIFFLGYLIAVLLKKAPYKMSIIYTTFIYMFIYLQPTLLGGFMSLVSERTISSYNWVQADVSYRSDTKQHIDWSIFGLKIKNGLVIITSISKINQIVAFIVPNLLLWAFILPIGLLVNLVRNKENLNSNYTRLRWGYFYNEYRLTAYFWEFTKIFQKEMIIIFLIFFQDTIIVKGLLIFFMIFLYGAIAMHVKPYQSNTLNFLDIESTAVCTVSMSGGVLCYAADLNGLYGLSLLLIIIVLLLNMFFIIQMVIVLLYGYIEKFQVNYSLKFSDHIDKIRAKIIEKRPNLPIEYPYLRKILSIRSEMRLRILYLWGILRYETRQGIKRQRLDKYAPLIQSKLIIDEIQMVEEKFKVVERSKLSIHSENDLIVQPPPIFNERSMIKLKSQSECENNLTPNIQNEKFNFLSQDSLDIPINPIIRPIRDSTGVMQKVYSEEQEKGLILEKINEF